MIYFARFAKLYLLLLLAYSLAQNLEQPISNDAPIQSASSENSQNLQPPQPSQKLHVGAQTSQQQEQHIQPINQPIDNHISQPEMRENMQPPNIQHPQQEQILQTLNNPLPPSPQQPPVASPQPLPSNIQPPQQQGQNPQPPIDNQIPQSPHQPQQPPVASKQPLPSSIQPPQQQGQPPIPPINNQMPKSPQQPPVASYQPLPPNVQLPHQLKTKPSSQQQGFQNIPPSNQQVSSRSKKVQHHNEELDYLMYIPSPRTVEVDTDGHFFSSSKHFVSMTVIVRPSAKDCYFYEPETNFDVDFQVLRGDKLDVGLIVVDPVGTPVVFRPAVSEGATPIHVLPEFRRKPFAICLDNRKASHGEKTVFLAIDLHLNWQNPTEEDMNLINTINFRIAKQPGREDLRQHIENLEKMSTKVDRIATLLHRAQRLQQRSRNRASIDRVLMESNRQHIMAWSTFQLFLMLCVGVVQTLLIRSLFDEKSSFYRLWVRGGSNMQKFTHSAPRY